MMKELIFTAIMLIGTGLWVYLPLIYQQLKKLNEGIDTALEEAEENNDDEIRFD